MLYRGGKNPFYIMENIWTTFTEEQKQNILNFVNNNTPQKKTLHDRLLVECSERWAMQDFLNIISKEGWHSFTREDIAKAFGYAWSITEFLYPYKSSLKLIMSATENYRQHFMDEEEYEVYKSLPNKIRIYRGASDRSGLSWTLSKEKAEWFAERNEYWTRSLNNNTKQQVFTREISKKKVYAYLNGRKEEEIIIY